MADEQEYEITLKWQNGSHFKVTTKKNSNPKVVLVKIEENGRIGAIWSGAQAIVIAFMTDILNQVGNEMKKP